MSSGGGGGGTSQVTNTTAPPEYVKPWAEQMMQRAGDLSNRDYQANPYQQVSPMTSQQTAGLDMTANMATNGDPTMNATRQDMTKTINGDYLNPDTNPYLAMTAQRMGDSFNATTGSQNAAMQRTAGAFGNSGLGQKMAMDNGQFAGQLAGLYGQNYANERQNMMTAEGRAPTMQQAGFQQAQNLTGVGDAYRQYGQDVLNNNANLWSQQYNAPLSNLDILANGVRTGMGSGGTSTQTSPNPYQPNRMANMIGGGMAGYGLAQAAGYNPMIGAGVGSGAGLLM